MSRQRQVPDTVRDLVGDAMSKIAGEVAAETAAREREAELLEVRARRLRIAAVMLVPACLALTALNLSGFRWFGDTQAQRLSPAESREVALLLLSDAVEELELAHRQDGSYPSVPGFIGPDGPDGEDEPFSYELVGPHRYLLSVTVGDETFRFDSREDPDLVFREVKDAR